MAATDRTQQILPGGQSSAPFTYTVPGSTSFTLLGVRASFDGSGAASAYLPCVQLVSDAGVLMAQSIGTSVAAGASADVTFAPFSSGTSTPCPNASTYNEAIIAMLPDAFWKLNELSGSTAHDSSGNGHHATTRATFADPTWDQVGLVNGDPSAFFARGSPFDPGPAVSMSTAYSFPVAGDFTMLGWMNKQDTTRSTFLTYGTALTTSLGASIAIEGASDGLNNRAFFRVANGVTQQFIEGDNQIGYGTGWHMIAGVVRSGVMYLYVDGAVQTTTHTFSFGSSSQTVYMGLDGTNIANTGVYGDVQYTAFWGSHALTAYDIAQLYALATG